MSVKKTCAFIIVLSFFFLLFCFAAIAQNTDIILGDVDKDHKVTVLDSMRIQKFLAQICHIDGSDEIGSPLTDDQKTTADVDKDNAVTILDAIRIQRYLANLCLLDGTPVTPGEETVIPTQAESEMPDAMLTIIDDDGNIKYYTQLYPMAVKEGVPIAAALPASLAGKPGRITWEMAQECIDNGMEILCHTYSHPLSPDIDNLTQEFFEADYQAAKDAFTAHGINADLLVFSGSTGYYDKAQIPARKLFKGAFLAVNNRTNFSGADPYKIRRYRIGTDYAFETETLKQLIDDLERTRGWMVWMIHTSNSSTWRSDVPEILSQVIGYAKEKDIPIVSVEYGFSQYFESDPDE